MKSNLSIMWGSLVFRGIVGILFGIAAVFWPGLTLVTLVYLFSIYIMVSGIINIIESIMSLGEGSSWVWKMLIGFAEIGVGVYLVRHPNVSFATMILILGLVLIARGVLEVVSVLLDEASATEKTLIGISGVLAVVVGIVVLLQPAASGVAFVWVLGLYALITGPMWIALGIDAKNTLEGKHHKKHK